MSALNNVTVFHSANVSIYAQDITSKIIANNINDQLLINLRLSVIDNPAQQLSLVTRVKFIPANHSKLKVHCNHLDVHHCDLTCIITHIVRSRQKKWMGHVQWHDCLPVSLYWVLVLVLDLYLSTIFGYWYLYLYLHGKYRYLYCYLDRWYWYWYL